MEFVSQIPIANTEYELYGIGILPKLVRKNYRLKGREWIMIDFVHQRKRGSWILILKKKLWWFNVFPRWHDEEKVVAFFERSVETKHEEIQTRPGAFAGSAAWLHLRPGWGGG